MSDGELPAHVRALIDAGRGAPVHADRLAIRARVGATIGAPVAGAAAGGALKVLMGAAVAVLAVVGGVYLANRASTTSTSTSTTSTSTSTSTSTTSTTLALAPAPQPAPAESPAAPIVTSPSAAVTPRARVAVHAAPAQEPDEAALLADATRAQAHGDYDRVLVVVAEHARRFANGALAEERDALELESLLALGRRGDAAAAARRFAASYPHSVHAQLVERAEKAPQ